MSEQEGDGVVLVEGNRDQAIMEQVNQIQEDIAKSVPLVGGKTDIQALEREFDTFDDVYVSKLKDLCSRYISTRKTRGDGNCFYRAFGFACLEASLTEGDLLMKLESAGSFTKEKLVEIGYPAYTVEDFHETFAEMIGVTRKGESLDEVVQLFNDSGYSDYFVVFLRLVVSCHLQVNHEFFSAFLEGHASVADFCKTEVEPMSAESDHIHAIALTAATGITIQIEYLDRGGSDGKLNQHRFPDDGSTPNIFLLYRPGHYDVLYKKSAEVVTTN